MSILKYVSKNNFFNDILNVERTRHIDGQNVLVNVSDECVRLRDLPNAFWETNPFS